MFDPLLGRHEIRTVVTPWRSIMNGIINLFFVGIAVYATLGTWAIILVVLCILFRMTLVGYVTPAEYFEDIGAKIEKLAESIGYEPETEQDTAKQDEIN